MIFNKDNYWYAITACLKLGRVNILLLNILFLLGYEKSILEDLRD